MCILISGRATAAISVIFRAYGLARLQADQREQINGP